MSNEAVLRQFQAERTGRIRPNLPLQSRISADAQPVPHTAFLDWHRSVRCVFADRMRHAVLDLLRIVTDGQGIVIEQGERTLLDSGGSIPAARLAKIGSVSVGFEVNLLLTSSSLARSAYQCQNRVQLVTCGKRPYCQWQFSLD